MYIINVLLENKILIAQCAVSCGFIYYLGRVKKISEEKAIKLVNKASKDAKETAQRISISITNIKPKIADMLKQQQHILWSMEEVREKLRLVNPVDLNDLKIKIDNTNLEMQALHSKINNNSVKKTENTPAYSADSTQQIYSTQQIAHELDIPIDKIYGWKNRKLITALARKYGRSVMYHESQLPKIKELAKKYKSARKKREKNA